MTKQNGKGSKPRPLSISREEFNKHWDNIFNKPRNPNDKNSTRS